MINMENSNDVQNTTNVGNEVLADVTNRTYSVDEVKILLEQQKQVCANEFIHAEMTIEQAIATNGIRL
jgi:hypothetical protein